MRLTTIIIGVIISACIITPVAHLISKNAENLPGTYVLNADGSVTYTKLRRQPADETQSIVIPNELLRQYYNECNSDNYKEVAENFINQVWETRRAERIYTWFQIGFCIITLTSVLWLIIKGKPWKEQEEEIYAYQQEKIVMLIFITAVIIIYFSLLKYFKIDESLLEFGKETFKHLI